MAKHVIHLPTLSRRSSIKIENQWEIPRAPSHEKLIWLGLIARPFFSEFDYHSGILTDEATSMAEV